MAEEHSPSLRDALSASYDAISSGSETPAAAPQQSTPAAAPAATPAPSGDRSRDPGSKTPRDPHGRFAPGTPGAAEQPGAAAAPAEPEMPEGYDNNVWALLTPEARATTAGWAGKQRETLAEREKRLAGYEPMERVLSSRRDVLTAQYGSVDKALEQLFHLSDFAGRDLPGFIRYLTQQRGYDLNQLVQQQAQQQQQPQQQDPRAWVQQMVQEQLTQAEVDRSYNEFMGSKDFEFREDPRVKRVMAALLTSGEANDYRTAYDMATQAHPEIGPKRRAAEAAAAAQADTKRRAEAAGAKAAAAVSTVGAPGTARPANGGTAPASVRAALVSAFDREPSGRV